VSDAGSLFTDGAHYERVMGRWSGLAGEKFVGWLGVPPRLRWLDVGCGNGAFTEALIARCAPSAVMAIDPSEGQLSYARTRPGTKIADFRIGDAQALPFACGSFDVAAMALVIVFLPDPAQAVAEMTRVVRPGGWIATYMWDMPGGGFPLEPLSVALKSLDMAPLSPPNAAASRRDNLQTLWQQAGLQFVDTQVIRVPIAYADFDDFWESNTAPTGPSGKAIQALPPGAKEQLQQRLREQLPIGRDRRIAYEAFANAVKGRVPE
jgi:ubiquinone/menaquinone biosynthesis C-methylase UbiE